MSFIIRMSACADPNENMANSFSYIGKVREKAEKSFDSFFSSTSIGQVERAEDSDTFHKMMDTTRHHLLPIHSIIYANRINSWRYSNSLKWFAFIAHKI